MPIQFWNFFNIKFHEIRSSFLDMFHAYRWMERTHLRQIRSRVTACSVVNILVYKAQRCFSLPVTDLYPNLYNKELYTGKRTIWNSVHCKREKTFKPLFHFFFFFEGCPSGHFTLTCGNVYWLFVFHYVAEPAGYSHTWFRTVTSRATCTLRLYHEAPYTLWLSEELFPSS